MVASSLYLDASPPNGTRPQPETSNLPRSDPSPHAQPRGWLQRTGIFGAYLFALFALLGITPATVGLLLFVLAFLFHFRDWRALSCDPLAVTALVFTLYAAVHSLATYLTTPLEPLADAALEAGGDWMKLLLFIPFAYWAGGDPKRIRLLLLLALMGFAVATLRKIDWAGFDASFFATRFANYLPPIAFGMYTGLGTLGLVALREHFWHPASDGIPRWLRATSWLLLLVMMLEGLMLSYSRGSWLSFAIAACFLIYLESRTHRRAAPVRGANRGVRILAAAAVAVAITALVAVQSKHIVDRLQGESETLASVLSGDFADLPSNSAGLRVHALRFAADLWSQRPWTGWGAGSSRYLVAHSGRPDTLKDDEVWLAHLHNTYAEILVQLGILGFLLVVAQVWLLVRGSTAARRKGRMPGDLGRFFAVALVFVLIWNLTSYRVIRHDYIFFWIVFAGSAYSFRLRALLQERSGLPSPAPRQESG